jgi:hypothetical protein
MLSLSIRKMAVLDNLWAYARKHGSYLTLHQAQRWKNPLTPCQLFTNFDSFNNQNRRLILHIHIRIRRGSN